MKILLLVIVAIILMTTAPANADPHQIVTTSWAGLSGLYIVPTARIIGKGRAAIGFNESKHTEFVSNGKFTDRHVRGVLTYGLSDFMEIYASYYNDIFVIARGPDQNNQAFTTFGLKLRLLKEDEHFWYPEVSLGVRDITNQTRDIGPLQGINNGTKVFLVASKKLFKNDAIGRFMDVHAGLTFDEQQVSGVAGFELTLAPNVSLIAEGMWDSPYINFRDYGQNDRPGRFIFNPGIRIYPELVPGLVLDMGFIGDSEFEFSFGTSYVIGL